MPKALAAGDKAPAFKLPADGGEKLSLADLKGQTVVVYFYPKDDTSGCTKEAIDFSAAGRKFNAAGAVVVGISKDSAASHDKFKTKHKLTVRLAADEDTKIAEAYGVWGEKTLYGRKYMGVERATFLVDGKGVIREIWRKVRVPGHVDEVLAAARALNI